MLPQRRKNDVRAWCMAAEKMGIGNKGRILRDREVERLLPIIDRVSLRRLDPLRIVYDDE